MEEPEKDRLKSLTPLPGDAAPAGIPRPATPAPVPPSDLESDTLEVGSHSVLNHLQGILEDRPGIQLPSAEPDEAAPRSDAALKYQIDSEIGKGGMGTVYKVFDGDLRRWVAMKLVRADATHQKELLSRFIEEAQVCGQLEHPNIPPVHEMGLNQNGQVYFTMKLVRGRTVQEIARDLSLGRPEVRREFTPIRIAQVLQQAAMGVHYANVRGVIHRDLKPDNIMVGDYGEVLVMDWGLAKVCGESESRAHLFGEDSVLTARTESGLKTVAGSVQGTPSYMSPEQARGEQDSIDSRSDVFGLGGVLYTLLCYQAPFRGRTVEEILSSARTGNVIPPSRVAPKRTEVPPDLEAICLKALSGERESRHADAREFQQDLQSYIEGTRDRQRRRAHATALVAEGRKQIASFLAIEKKRQELRREVQKAGEGLLPADPVERKKPLWAMEDSIGQLAEEAAKLFSGARAALDAAIQNDPGCQEARKALADLYWSQFLEAEARRDSHNAALYRGLVETHDNGQYKALLKGDGSLALKTEPPGAEAVLHRYAEEDRLLVPREPRSLGSTPLAPVVLPMGSYLVVLKLPGYRDVRYPVSIGRSENHQGFVRLFREEEIGADFVHVPAGEFFRGGDPESFGGLERARVMVGDFFISRFPVTLGEYCEFLDSLALEGGSVKEHIPRLEEEVCVELDPSGRYRPAEILVEGETRKRYPPGFEKGCPAMAMSWHSAMAYARWRSRRDRREYELPSEDAWEKAARGVDGRFHAWGDAFDWTFAKGGLSRPERAQPEPVGVFPADESPYGVRDMVGTIREWTQSWFDERADLRVVRGGSWNLVGTRHFRCATRFGYASTKGTTTVGFRLFTTRKAARR